MTEILEDGKEAYIVGSNLNEPEEYPTLEKFVQAIQSELFECPGFLKHSNFDFAYRDDRGATHELSVISLDEIEVSFDNGVTLYPVKEESKGVNLKPEEVECLKEWMDFYEAIGKASPPGSSVTQNEFKFASHKAYPIIFNILKRGGVL